MLSRSTIPLQMLALDTHTGWQTLVELHDCTQNADPASLLSTKDSNTCLESSWAYRKKVGCQVTFSLGIRDFADLPDDHNVYDGCHHDNA